MLRGDAHLGGCHRAKFGDIRGAERTTLFSSGLARKQTFPLLEPDGSAATRAPSLISIAVSVAPSWQSRAGHRRAPARSSAQRAAPAARRLAAAQLPPGAACGAECCEEAAFAGLEHGLVPRAGLGAHPGTLRVVRPEGLRPSTSQKRSAVSRWTSCPGGVQHSVQLGRSEPVCLGLRRGSHAGGSLLPGRESADDIVGRELAEVERAHLVQQSRWSPLRRPPSPSLRVEAVSRSGGGSQEEIISSVRDGLTTVA